MYFVDVYKSYVLPCVCCCISSKLDTFQMKIIPFILKTAIKYIDVSRNTFHKTNIFNRLCQSFLIELRKTLNDTNNS